MFEVKRYTTIESKIEKVITELIKLNIHKTKYKISKYIN